MLGMDNVDMTEAFQFPSTRRELLDELQMRVVIFSDRVEINAVFPIAPIVYQKCTSREGGISLPLVKGRETEEVR